jgi:hypothetical protein
MQWIDWCLAHWETVLGVAFAVLSVLNAVTEHSDGASGVRRLLLVALDVVSGLRSRDAATGVGTPRGLAVLKVPLLQRSPGQSGESLVARVERARRGES